MAEKTIVGEDRTCDRERCGTEYTVKTSWHRYCSSNCRVIDYQKRRTRRAARALLREKLGDWITKEDE